MKFLRVILSVFLLAQPSFAATCTDDFTVGSDTLLTSYTGPCGTWTLQSGSSGNGNVLAATDNVKDNAGNAPNIYSDDITPASAEYDISLDVTGTSDCMGPSGRVVAAANTSYFVVYNNGASEWRLVERIAGVSTTLDTATVAGGAPDPALGVVNVRLEIRDDSKTVYLNDVESMTHTATNDISDAGFPGIKFSGVTSDRGDNWIFADVGGAAVQQNMTLLGVQ